MYKTRIFLSLLMFLYLGFMIGRISAPKENIYLELTQAPSESWQEAWDKSRNLQIRCHLIIEDLWSNEDKLVEIVFKDNQQERVIGYCILVQKKPGSVWNYDIGYLITAWDKPSKDATIFVRSVQAEIYSFDCGYSRFRFEYKPRPLTDEELNK